ncbi:MAG: hypothetical protein ACRCS5_17270 [Sphingomonas sp.]|uniref:hypothetical protein n=1 Tax=Sphingomonas sp. TaxID=28214 RepID=UPI0030F9ADC5
MARSAPCLAFLLLAGCGAQSSKPPPPRVTFAGLPVSGSVADGRRAGFTDCVAPDWGSLRCRRHGVMIEGTGPYEAAVDLTGNDGSGGFDQVTVWHDQDQYAVYKITDVLEKQGWKNCSTGSGDRGDQIIYTRAGMPVRVSMDLSYWGKRRLRMIPAWNKKERQC